MVCYEAHTFALADLASLLFLIPSTLLYLLSHLPGTIFQSPQNGLAGSLQSFRSSLKCHFSVRSSLIPQILLHFIMPIFLLTSYFSLAMRAEIAAVTPEHCLEYSKSFTNICQMNILVLLLVCDFLEIFGSALFLLVASYRGGTHNVLSKPSVTEYLWHWIEFIYSWQIWFYFGDIINGLYMCKFKKGRRALLLNQNTYFLL